MSTTREAAGWRYSPRPLELSNVSSAQLPGDDLKLTDMPGGSAPHVRFDIAIRGNRPDMPIEQVKARERCLAHVRKKLANSQTVTQLREAVEQLHKAESDLAETRGRIDVLEDRRSGRNEEFLKQPDLGDALLATDREIVALNGRADGQQSAVDTLFKRVQSLRSELSRQANDIAFSFCNDQHAAAVKQHADAAGKLIEAAAPVLSQLLSAEAIATAIKQVRPMEVAGDFMAMLLPSESASTPPGSPSDTPPSPPTGTPPSGRDRPKPQQAAQAKQPHQAPILAGAPTVGDFGGDDVGEGD